jgi:hypothetical protein
MVVAVDSEGDLGRLFFFSGECTATADLVDVLDDVDMSSSFRPPTSGSAAGLNGAGCGTLRRSLICWRNADI